MFENILKEYTARSYSMQGEHDLILTYLTGSFLDMIFALIYGYVLVRAKIKNPTGRGMMIYWPFGLWLIGVGLKFFTNILSVWHNYLWIYTLLVLITGLVGLINLVLLPSAKKERDEIRNCQELREDYDKLEREVLLQREIINKYLKIGNDYNPTALANENT